MTVEYVFRTPEQGQPNDRALLKADASETRGAYILRASGGPPGLSVPPHIHHAEEEAWYILSGDLTFSIGDRSFLAPTGSFVLVPRGTVHSFSNTGTQPARFLNIFSPPGMERFFVERTALAETMTGRDGLDFAGLDPDAHQALARKYNMEFV